MKEDALISIAMATYNGERYLKEQLDSIYSQTYKNIEVVVTDDCSTDGTIKILEQYSKSHGLKYYVNEENLGFVKNFEKAISLCQGDFIALSDQDDIWEKEKIEILVDKIGSNLLIHSDCSVIDDEGKSLMPFLKQDTGNLISVQDFFFRNVVTGCTVLFSKKLLDTALPFPEGIAYHDWWLGFCAAKEKKIHYFPQCLTRYRKHSGQDTGLGDGERQFILKSIYAAVKKRHNNVEFQRIFLARKHINSLYALKHSNVYTEEYSDLLKDAILYFEDYVKNKVHLKAFLIGLKDRKILYPQKNYFFLKNILFDIVG